MDLLGFHDQQKYRRHSPLDFQRGHGLAKAVPTVLIIGKLRDSDRRITDVLFADYLLCRRGHKIIGVRCSCTSALVPWRWARSPQIEQRSTAEQIGRVKVVFPSRSGSRRNMSESFNKVPEVTLSFWIIKIAATTLGETGGDTVTMTLNWGYLAGTALFLAALVVLVNLQIISKKFHPFLYWATIIASTTFGTTMADFADRSLGIRYTGGSSLLLMCLLAPLALWDWSLGSINVDTVSAPETESVYWACIACSQALG